MKMMVTAFNHDSDQARASIRKLLDLDPASVWPGHANPVTSDVRGQLSEKEISDLTFAIVAINGWNRLSVAFKTVPGSADALYGLDKAGLK